jgi:hypothetical protein
MSNEFDEDQKKFLTLQPKEKILFVREQVDEIVSTLTQKNIDVDIFITRIAHFKTYTSRLFRLSGVYKKDYFDFLVYSIRTMWDAVENCTSQFMLYPALSAFIDLFSKLKGLNPYYTLDGAIEQTLEYGKLPSKDKIAELLQQEKQHLNFLIDYMQLDSILRLNLTKFEKKNIVKSATNYAQILVLTLYNFLVTIPVISKEDFLDWCKLFDDALEKARLGHHYLKEIEEEPFELLKTRISESSLFSLKAQLHLLSARFTNENVNEFLNLAYIDNSRALSEIEPYKKHELFSESVKSFYIQQKALLLETRFYQILHNIQITQYKNSIYVGDRKDEKPELTKSLIKFEIEEILSEIEGYVKDLLSRSRREELGISFNLISIYAKISLGAYIYDLVDDVSTMEEIIKTQRIDVGDPELSLLLARYWLIRWSEDGDEDSLKSSQSYFDRAAEVYQMLFNNRYVPIYGYTMVALYQLYRKNIPRAEIYLMKADDEYTDAKMLKILSSSEQYYYEKFREQIDRIIKGEKIERPLRFDKPLNPLDFNSWLTEKKDWRKELSSFPEPFPFHLDQLKILEFEFLSPENNNFQEKADNL